VKGAVPFFCILAASFCALPSTLPATDLDATGSWFETVSAADLSSGPGSNLVSEYTSPADQATFDVSDANDWEVHVSRTDTSWSGNARLFIMRSSGGTGSGQITGGTSFSEVTPTSQQLCTGTSGRAGVGLQFRLTGISIQIPPGNYSTTVTLTVTDK
jgi:hypothetical protein